MKFFFASYFLVIVGFIALVFFGCASDEDYANPLDPQNLRTAGSPPGLTLIPGDRQVTVSWRELNSRITEGIKGYRISSRFTEYSNTNF